MLSSMDIWGKRLKSWETIPMFRRTASMLRVSRLRVSQLKSTPSTMISPRWCSSSWLRMRRKVDLPDPEGPMITTVSPCLIVVVTPRTAW